MDPLLPAIGWCLVILILEATLWVLFKRRFLQIGLPASDPAVFHLFSLGRVRFFIVLHTLALCAVSFLTHFLLWR